MKKLGIIGGLGPLATAYFLELIVKMTQASCDQEHLDIILYNSPSIPDRTQYLLGRSSESPIEPMIEIGCQLAMQDVGAIAIPCITAHCFHDTLQAHIEVPIIHLVHEIALYLLDQHIYTLGIMATDGTLSSRLFQHVLGEYGIKCVVPSKAKQCDVMDLIYKQIKSNKPIDMQKFYLISRHLWQQGAQLILLGCTELSLIKKDYPIGRGYLDAMEILARASILKCEGKLKSDYYLLTKEGDYDAK